MNSIEGKILKGIGGFYTIQDSAGILHECRARGLFRLKGITPLVGDRVVFSDETGQDGYIEDILGRKNEMVRPPVANIDNLVIVLAASRPKPDLLLADKLILQAEKNDARPVVCLNKTDASASDTEEDLKKQYGPYEFLAVSARTESGIKELKDVLSGKTSAFAGQSAVGKSSLLNVLGSDIDLKTGTLSKKTSRGKHTTRQTELFYLKDINAFAMDTPGFSIFDAVEIEESELGPLYREFLPCLGKCRFLSCLHANEPDCAVKKAVEAGDIHPARYERYIMILNMLKEKREKKYD